MTSIKTAGPVLDPAIASIAPGFRAISLLVEARPIEKTTLGSALLNEAAAAVSAGTPAWAEDHLQSWSDVYLKFGAKPNRTPCSALALRKRVLRDGSMASINPVVDLYNAVSLQYAVPVGGEDYDAYAGQPFLTIANGTEDFDTVANGDAVTEHPTDGEVIWRDDVGVTCRRWNWRQGTRTRLELSSRRMWFILESLPTMPEDALVEAAAMLSRGLEQLMPGCAIDRQRVSVEGDR